jgi:hypothetical protein
MPSPYTPTDLTLEKIIVSQSQEAARYRAEADAWRRFEIEALAERDAATDDATRDRLTRRAENNRRHVEKFTRYAEECDADVAGARAELDRRATRALQAAE